MTKVLDILKYFNFYSITGIVKSEIRFLIFIFILNQSFIKSKTNVRGEMNHYQQNLSENN